MLKRPSSSIRPHSASRPLTSTSNRPTQSQYIVVLNEGRGLTSEVGLAALDLKTSDSLISQVNDAYPFWLISNNLICQIPHLSIYSTNHSLNYSSIHTSYQSCTQLLIYPYIVSIMHSTTHLSIYSTNHHSILLFTNRNLFVCINCFIKFADSATYVRVLHHLNVMNPALVFMFINDVKEQSFFQILVSDSNNERFQSRLSTIIKDNFDHIDLKFIHRKYFNDQQGANTYYSLF